MHADRRRHRVPLQVPVFVQEDPHVYPDGPAFQPGRGYPRVFQRFPGEFEQDALLGIDVAGFPRRDVEEPRVESVDFIDESAAGGIVLAVRPVFPQRFSFIRHGAYRVSAVQDEFPEGLGRRYPTGKPTGDSGYRNGFT